MFDVNPCKELADEIRRILRSGIELSPEVAEFIDSTYASPNAREFLAILTADSDADRDTLLELIFAPDEPLQERLEPLLTRHRFSVQDESDVVKRLQDPIPEAILIFPDDRGRLTATPPDWILETLLRQLRIDRQLPARVADVVTDSVKETQQNRVRVCLRNVQTDFSEPQIECLCHYLVAADTQSPHFFRKLEFLLHFLSGLNKTDDIYEAFMAHKIACRSQLERALKQEKILAENNVETLLLRGERILHYDKEGLMQDIAAIDDICLAVFGKTEVLLPKESTIDLGDYQDPEDLDRLMQRLAED